MKIFVLKIILALSFGILLSSCDKAGNINEIKDDNEIDGIYIGTYKWTNLTRDWWWSSTPIIELKNGKYSYKKLSNGYYYNNGSGNFTINGDKIIFELTYYDIPIETIGVVDDWLLKGEYECKFDGNILICSKTATVMEEEYRYEFELKKK